ncbi:MAG: thymidine phosphorylase [Candidatus Bipolaricaulota bacterium]
MRAVDIIERKRDGAELTAEEIRWLVHGHVAGRVPDYQMAAWLMAVYQRGMSREETVALTEAMVDSGERVDLSSVPGLKVDKHSTGGVGDTVTLVLVPLMASAGLVCAKMSGRSLGHTGGTIDKLESIPGLRTELELEEILNQAATVGAVIAEHTAELAPADRLLYALRDVTATVASLPLIVGSILSKKLAGGADAVVLDVKCGHGAFMESKEDALHLAQTLVSVGNRMGKRFSALITGMDQPLGRMVGNALEVRQAVEVLRGEGPGDLREVTLALGAELVVLAGEAGGVEEARRRLQTLLQEGRAWEEFVQLVQAQGGDVRAVEDLGRLPQTGHKEVVEASRSGYVQHLAARNVGLAASLVGAGRTEKAAPVDPTAGVELAAKVGDQVKERQPLALLHVGRAEHLQEAKRLLADAYTIGNEAPSPPPLIIDAVRSEE